MSTKNYILAMLLINAALNAIFINLQLVRVIDISWWLIFSPTWLSIFIIAADEWYLPLKRKAVKWVKLLSAISFSQ